ncbi:MAG: chromosome segregation protein SMC [Erysipelotrichales bacterium]|nr:chromosome segregation protein SMC [Erysipelotrichales bacterium]
MKLLSIKAFGFKSFADKVEINVNDGITGIVGPNGSGKSNVVDAVKWVLGESSLKEIRGGEQSSDVIFAGSNSRKPLSRAWVSLTFDNSDHYLATELSEVEIKREVYKTGESEYFINNTKVRKKDITDLFLDSGANADSFSIISQGKILEILKGKPQDRRVIIEEASGVLKYKKRKDESMRKLNNTNDNLEKVNLVINELESNIEPLRIQAEAATKYLEYKGELESIEVSLVASDIKKINEEYSKAKDEVTRLNDEIMGMDKSSNVDNAKLESLKVKSDKLDNEISSLNEELINLNQSISALETRKQVITERKKYEVEDQKLESNIIILKEREVSLKKDINLLEKELSALNKTLEEKTTKNDDIREEYRVLNMRKDTLNQELTSKTKELIGSKNRIDVLNENIENDTKLPYAVKSVLNNPRLNGVHDVLVKLIDTEEKYAKALEVSMGGNANVIVVDDEKAATTAISYLKDNKLGRATFFPISVIKSRFVDESIINACRGIAGFIDVASNLVTFNPLYKNIVENQLGNILIVDNIDTMNKLGKKLNYSYRIVTLDGEILHTGGAMTGGINKSSSGLINIRFELDKLIKDSDILTNEIKLLEEHVNQVDDEIKILEDKVFANQGELVNLQEQISRKNIELSNINKNLDDCLLELKGTDNVLKNEVDKELDEVLSEYLKLTSSKDELVIKLNGLKSNKSDLLSNINELESINRKNNSEYNKRQNELRDLEVSIGKMDVKLDSLLNKLNEEYQITYEKAISEYSLDMDEDIARTKVNHLRRQVRDLGDVNVGSISEYERVNTRYTFLSDQKRDLEHAIEDLMQIISDLDEEMQKRFEETFHKVNEEFGLVFKKLFKGGNAKLILTEPEDMLTTGVDIIAEPPGKNLKSINTLSGGEMTLTAIALLFSILNIRTVPFCILDEVEAALDEVNVDQFGTYIQEYKNSSQFIVITHKKRTMEYADTLYGITMQESGVSKLVSVKLENL